jgi:hypothetical protein
MNRLTRPGPGSDVPSRLESAATRHRFVGFKPSAELRCEAIPRYQRQNLSFITLALHSNGATAAKDRRKRVAHIGFWEMRYTLAPRSKFTRADLEGSQRGNTGRASA